MGRRQQVRENVRITAKKAAKRAEGLSAAFPEFPRALPLIPQRYSQRSRREDLPAVAGVLAEPDPLVFTKKARELVSKELRRWRRPRLSEETLKIILGDLSTPIYEAKYVFTSALPPEVTSLRKRLDAIAELAPRLRNYLEALGPVEGQIGLGDVMHILDEQCPHPRDLARYLQTLELAAKKVRPGRQTVGHPKAGTIGTRYLAGQIAGLLEKHRIPASATPGSIYEGVVSATWPCVDESTPPKNMTRFLRSILA
jgi:hypothetical protein